MTLAGKSRLLGLVMVGLLVWTGCGIGTPQGTPQVVAGNAGSTVTTEAPSPGATSATPSASASTESATPSATPTETADPPVLAPGDTGDAVRELQARLAQLDWYSGQITPDYDDATTRGVAGFQGKRGLPDSGVADQTTWDTLVGMTKTPTREQMYNILVPGPALLKQGDSSDKVRDLQVRLRQIGWYAGDISGSYDAQTVTGVKGFQGKREIPVTGEVDQRTLDRLRAMTKTPTEDQKNNVKPTPPPLAAGGLDARCMTGRVLCIDKSTNKLVWVVDGAAQMSFDVRFGAVGTPTREGVFSVFWKSRHHVSTLYQSDMPFAMFFSGGQAVHYSADFAARGYNGASHGCVNVRDYNGLASLFDQVREGDTVVVYRS